MWLLNRGGSFLPKTSLKTLNKLYSLEKNVKAKMRYLVAIRRKRGDSIDDIARILEKPRRTIHGWLHRFEQDGLNGAYDKKQPGRCPWLSKQQLNQLRKDLLRGPAYMKVNIWTMRLVQNHIKSKYGVSYKRHNIYKLLRALGFSVQKPRPRHYKADVVVQEHFKKKRDKFSAITAVMDGRSHVWTSVPSASNHTLSEDGH